MKIRTPYYYKQFKCVAGDCTDTCCAGWDVDVDEESYRFYKSVKGEFGKRLKSVMVPEKEGGCTFTLTEDKRCPFLNDKNLCDLYTELGEEHLCETCDEFPRFINEYGGVKEIGIAPSCITAGEIMFAEREKMYFDEYEDGKQIGMYNDIDAFLYMQLCNARNLAFDIIDNEQFSTDEVCVLLLEFAYRIQKHMDAERDDRIASVVKRFRDVPYCKELIKTCRRNKKDADNMQVIAKYFDSFKDMEVINPDWLKYVERERVFENNETGRLSENIKKFNDYYKDREYQFRQLLDYYVYRYFLDSVYDINLVLKIKNAVVGYLVVRQLDMVCWYENGSLTYDEHVDIAHLYSRQFEHSYTNFEVYSDYFMRKRCYGKNAMEGLLLN